MAHINLVDPAHVDGTVRETFDDVERVRGQGRVSNLLRGYALHPDLLRANWERMKVLLYGGYLSRRLKESVLVALAEVNGCAY
jgi:alkylhydroperoxidase family enzyme